jgi:hypothetical protein
VNASLGCESKSTMPATCSGNFAATRACTRPPSSARLERTDRHIGALEQGVQVGGDSKPILRTSGRVTPAVSRTIVDADLRITRNSWRDPAGHGRRELAEAGLEHHRGATCARALDVQPVAAYIDQLAVHGLGAVSQQRQPAANPSNTVPLMTCSCSPPNGPRKRTSAARSPKNIEPTTIGPIPYRPA